MKESAIAKLGPASSSISALDDVSSTGVSATFDRGEQIDAALEDAIRDALHKRMGNPVAAWSDGKVVWIKPEDLST